MEDKLLELKNEFCKYYCNKKEIEIKPTCDGCVYCYECEADILCEDGKISEYFNPCDYCKVNDFIRHIRDEL